MLTPNTFWKPLIDANQYDVLRGVIRKGGQKAPLEEAAKARVLDVLQRHAPGIQGGFLDEIEQPGKMFEYAKECNTIVIGAHPSNKACEELFCRQFKARSYFPDDRPLLPFRIVRREYAGGSTLFQPPIENPEGQSSDTGIYSEKKGRLIVRVDKWPQDEYLRLKGVTGHDGAIVLVVNRPFGTKKHVKLIILAGYSRVGSLAAAEALARDYRDLEPLRPDGYTIGVVDATFEKVSEGDHRELIGWKWVSLSGGRRQIG